MPVARHVASSRLPEDRLAPLSASYAQALRQKRLSSLFLMAAIIVAAIISGFLAEVAPARFAQNIGDFFSYFGRIAVFDDSVPDRPDLTGRFVLFDVGEWMWGIDRWLKLLIDTLLIAYLGTVLGTLGAFALCFLAAQNLMPNVWIRVSVKRYLEFCRTVPELVFALIFVIAFGLGPVPGVLAIAIHTMGANGKLFAEVAENIDMKPVEGVMAAGGSWVQMVRFAVVPQVLSNFVSYTLLRFEINVRGASVMGFVGAGGIGQNLIEAIRKFYYTDVSAILVLIIAIVMIIDLLTERLRHALIGRESSK
jgi:phosphonate transport system permease protein